MSMTADPGITSRTSDAATKAGTVDSDGTGKTVHRAVDVAGDMFRLDLHTVSGRLPVTS
jgi:hypothetical protein